MNDIDHKNASLDYLRGLEHVAEGDPAAIEITGGAQVHATLYLAEQQKLASIIAWTTREGHKPGPGMQSKIEKALGIA